MVAPAGIRLTAPIAGAAVVITGLASLGGTPPALNSKVHNEAAFRDAGRTVSSTPEGAAALARFNGGHEVAALAALDNLGARTIARGQSVKESAVWARRVAALALEALARGKLTPQQLVDRYERILRLDPSDSGDWLQLAKLYEMQGRPVDARWAAVAAVQTSRDARELTLPNRPEPLALGRSFSGAGQRYQALRAPAQHFRPPATATAELTPQQLRSERGFAAGRLAGNGQSRRFGAPAVQHFSSHQAISPGSSRAALRLPSPGPDLTAFPWPPPMPSERMNLTRNEILLPSMRSSARLSDVADRIVAALQAAGYSECSFYAVPTGFAIVARLERMEPDGRPAPEKFRFLDPDAQEPFSLTAYISQLFFAPEGYYRQIVFVVTSDVVRLGGAHLTAKAAGALLAGGSDRLPGDYRKIAFTEDYQVSALIYEYRKGAETRDVRSLIPGRLGARTNLERAGIYPRLIMAKR